MTESGEAALRRLLASRAIGGYSLTSDDPASESLTVVQPSRVARPQDASEALDLESLLSSSALTRMRGGIVCFVPFSEVADVEAQLGPAGRYVDAVFQHTRRHFEGFLRDSKKAGSVGFVVTAVEKSLFRSKKAETEGFIIDARAGNCLF